MRTVPLTHQRVTIQDDFDLDKILESGQCFRPRKLADGRCRFVSGKALLYLTPLGRGQYDAAWYGADWDVWAGYFDLGRSYAALRQSLAGQSAYLDAALACSSPSSSPSARASRPSALPSSSWPGAAASRSVRRAMRSFSSPPRSSSAASQKRS